MKEKTFYINILSHFNDFKVYVNTELSSKVYAMKFKPFEIRFSTGKRSNNQLKGYWRLIKICTDYMKEQGNNFIDEYTHIYMKLKAGLYLTIGTQKVPRSLNRKGDVTKEEMIHLINTVLAFGVENDIPDCILTNEEFQDIIKNYK